MVVGRWGYPPEIEGIVIFLASKASDFITGQTIYIDGDGRPGNTILLII